MKKLRYNSGQRRIALVTLLSFLALLYWPYGIARRHQAAQAETEVRSIYLLPLANRTEQDADLAERLTTALRLQLGPGSSITGPRPVELLRVTTENPLIELALQRGLITEEEVENPPTELTAAVEFARKLGVDSVVSGSIEEYSLSEDQEHLTIGLLLNEYPVATFTPENPEVHTYFVRGEADARRPGYILTRRQLENEAIMDTARKAAAALVSAPPPEKPKPPEKKRGRRNFLPALIGILVLTLLFNVGRGRDRAEGLAVQNLRAMPTRSSVILTWSPVGAGRASGYNIYRRIVGQRQLRTRSRQAEFQRIAFIEGGETSTWEDTSVQIGFEYEYAIAAVDLRGREGPRSTSAQATAGPGLASPPTNVQAIPGDGFIRLTWLPSPDPFVDGYNIYRRAAGGPEVLIATLPGTATEYTDTDVLNGVSYVYRIVAFMDVTAGTRSILEGTGVTTVAVTPTERPPEAPRGLVAEAGDAEVTLRWQPNLEADIDHYNIYRAQGGGRGLWGPRSRADLFGGKFGRPGRRGVRQGLTFAKIDEVPGTLTTYLDRNVTNNIAFTYRITAVDRAGNESEPSNEVTVVPNGPPPAPQGLQATGQDRQVTLRWLRLEGVPDLAGYNIYRSTTEFTARHPAEAGGITQLNLELLPPNVTTFTDLNLVNNTTFYYAVTAVDTFGVESNFSISVPATPHLPPASVSLSASPRTISGNGIATSQLTAVVVDADQQPTGGVPVIFTTTAGSLFAGTEPPAPGVVGGTTLTVQTDTQGVALALLRSAEAPEADISAAVTAQVPEITVGRNTATTIVLFRTSRASSVTVTAQPQILTADRASTSLITAQVVDALGNPVPDGTEVRFSIPDPALGALAGGTAAPVEGQTVATDRTVNGEAQATYRAGSKAGTVVVTATATRAGISGSVALTLNPGPPARIVKMTAQPDTLPADGSSTSTITVEVTDGEGNPVADGTTVSFTATLGTVGLTANTTNGVATTTFTAGQEVGPAVVVASVAGFSRQVEIELTPGPATQIRLEADKTSVPADGKSEVNITATVLDLGGNPVEPNTPVIFTTTAGTITPTAATDEEGKAYAVLTSSTRAGIATVSASSGGATETIDITFEAGAPEEILLDSSVPVLPADGSSTATITARVEDANGNPVADGTTVRFEVTSGSGRITPSATTISGVATAIYTAGTTAGTVIITASVQRPDGRTIARELRLQLAEPVPASLSITAEPAAISVSSSVGGDSLNAPYMTNEAILTVTARDSAGRLLPKVPIVLSCTDGFARFLPGNAASLTATTDERGVARANGELPRLRSSTSAGQVTVTASTQDGSVTADTTVNFIAGPPDRVLLTADPAVIPADGTSTSTLKAEVYDAVGNPVVDGTQVVFTTTAGTVTSPVSTWQGIATATLTSGTQPGTATVQARVGDKVSNSVDVVLSNIAITVTVTPATLRGDGVSTAQIVANVRTLEGTPVADGTVVQFETRIGVNPGPGRILNPTTTVGGRATATLQSTVVSETTAFQVVARAEGAEGRADVTFTVGAAGITLLAQPTVLLADGADQSTITAILTDENGNPRANEPVTFATTAGTIAAIGGISPGTTVTDAQGRAQATLTSSPQVGVATVTATSGTQQGIVQVTFRAGPPASLLLKVTPEGQKLVADGTAAFHLEATVRDQFGNPVAAGTVVTFASTLGTVRPSQATTGDNGIATAELTSTTAGAATVTATVLNTTISDSRQAEFVAGTPSRVTVSVNPTSIPADGSSTATVKATVYDLNDNLVDGAAVTFSATSGTVSPATATTRNGVATTTLRSGTEAGTVTITARVVLEDGVEGPSGDTTIIFTPRANLTIKLTASPRSIVADGTSTATITATVTDASTNQPVAANTLVTFTTTLGTINSSALTDAQGRATATLTSSTEAGIATVTASTSGAASRTVQVTFTAGPPANITLTRTKDTIVADGSDNTSITALVEDANGNPVPGAAVTFDSTFTNLLLNDAAPPATETTNSTGEAVVTVTGTTTGTAIITAVVGNIQGQTQVTLVPGPPSSVAVTASPTSIRANGVATSRITATVRDAQGNTVGSGILVRFSTTAGSIKADQAEQSIGPEVGRTVNGVATATLTSSRQANTVATIRATVIAVTPAGTETELASGTTQVTFVPGPPASVEASADPQSIPVTFTGQPQNTATITAVVRDDTGQPVANGTQVTFDTSLGTFASTGTTTATATTVNGVAAARLNSGQVAGTATVQATSQGVSGTVSVTFTPGPPATVTVSANPSNIAADGISTSTITVVVRDQAGNNVADGTVVTITTSGGRLPTIPPDKPDLDPAASGYQVGTVNGVAKATLTSSTEAGRQIVTASAGTAGGNTTVTFGGDVPANIALGFTPPVTYTPSIWADNTDTIGVTATITTKEGSPVSDGTTVRFRLIDKATGKADGLITPGTAQTSNGQVTATVRSSDNAGIHQVICEVYDGSGNVVLSARRDLYFVGNVYAIELHSSVNGGTSLSPPRRLRFQSKYDLQNGEVYPHGLQNVDPRIPAGLTVDNWYNQQDDSICYRARAMDQNGLPVPDGTTINFRVTGGGNKPTLSVTSAPTTNGWTSFPPNWTGLMSGGDAGLWTLWAVIGPSPGTVVSVATYNLVYVIKAEG